MTRVVMASRTIRMKIVMIIRIFMTKITMSTISMIGISMIGIAMIVITTNRMFMTKITSD